MQVMFVIGAQFALPENLALPRLDLGHDPRQQAQPIVGWQDRHPEHVAEHANQKQSLHRATHLECLLHELISGHAIEDFPQDLPPPGNERRDIVRPVMTEIIAIAAIVIVAWFAAGTAWNIQRGRLAMRWMQTGLRVLGERTTVRWLGSTAVEMFIRAGNAPFASVTLITFLEARDIPWVWVLGRARGRRDILIIRGVLRRVPHLEFEALDAASWSGREALRRLPSEWSAHPSGNAGDVTVYSADATAAGRASELLTEARCAGLDIKRLSVRRAEPHFQIHLALPDQGQPALPFFEAVQAIAEHVLD